ncbi:hypothetical protein E5288_WYG001750 [Bos mutus]|uniref:Uncharacterized protein n=1 Tax=Bos mutus TaxID=72004 RepID=A0A6B0RN71_9CETA|nr:hypothetical protein [Bos mutus]
MFVFGLCLSYTKDDVGHLWSRDSDTCLEMLGQRRFCCRAVDGAPADTLGPDFTVVHSSPVKMKPLLTVHAVHISEMSTASCSA